MYAYSDFVLLEYLGVAGTVILCLAVIALAWVILDSLECLSIAFFGDLDEAEKMLYDPEESRESEE